MVPCRPAKTYTAGVYRLNLRLAGDKSLSLPRTGFRPHRTCQLDSPHGAVLEERAFGFQKTRRFPMDHPDVRIRRLFPDDGRDDAGNATDIDFDCVTNRF